MKKNNYDIWYIDKSDTVYFKHNLFDLTAFEKIGLKFKGK